MDPFAARRPQPSTAGIILATAAIVIAAPTAAYAACNIINGRPYGDCANVQVNTTIKPHVEVRTPVLERGMIAGATVLDGGTLILYGTSTGRIVVKGGTLVVIGVVQQTIRNEGGWVHLEGIADQIEALGGTTQVEGVVNRRILGSGVVNIKDGAVIGGVAFEAPRTEVAPARETLHRSIPPPMANGSPEAVPFQQQMRDFLEGLTAR